MTLIYSKGPFRQKTHHFIFIHALPTHRCILLLHPCQPQPVSSEFSFLWISFHFFFPVLASISLFYTQYFIIILLLYPFLYPGSWVCCTIVCSTHFQIRKECELGNFWQEISLRLNPSWLKNKLYFRVLGFLERFPTSLLPLKGLYDLWCENYGFVNLTW